MAELDKIPLSKPERGELCFFPILGIDHSRLSTCCHIIFITLVCVLISFHSALAETFPIAKQKIGPMLRKDISDAETTPKLQAEQRAQIKAIGDSLVKVIVVINRDHLQQLPDDIVGELKARVENLGGRIGRHAYNNVQVWIPVENVERLAEWEQIKRIDQPITPQTNSIVSQGTNTVGAHIWQRNGFRGDGVKVGIIDIGFKGYDALLGTELPSSVATKTMGTEADFLSNIHGTACAEIVHDVAPEADLFLVNAGDLNVDFHDATTWLQSQGVGIISSSIGLNLRLYCLLLYYALNGYVNSDDIVNQIEYIDQLKQQWDNSINNTVANGITWVQAAGNDGQKKWKGVFNDSDGDYLLNFSTGINANKIDVSGADDGDDVYVLMMWGATTNFSTSDDYDLYVMDQSGNIVTSSKIRQSQISFGIESCKFIVDKNKTYYAVVQRYLTGVTPHEIVLLLGHEKFPNFKYYNPEGTVNLCPPAANPNVITVGAVSYADSANIESYSSQGPTSTGVVKPDFVGPDAVHTASYGSMDYSFTGTSAAAPHIAGVSALLKQIGPAWTPSQIKDYLNICAIDLGTSGKDNTFGSGMVYLSDFILAGDVNRSGAVQLEDAIITLQVLSGIVPAKTVYSIAAVNKDQRIGMGEGIFISQVLAGVRKHSVLSPLYEGSRYYYPLSVNNWWEFKDIQTGGISRTTVSGIKNIDGIDIFVLSSSEVSKAYKAFDSSGLKNHGSYSASPTFTGDILFQPPLLDIPLSFKIGDRKSSTTHYTISISGTIYNVDVEQTVTILGVEDVSVGGGELKDCIKLSRQTNQVIRETGEVNKTTIYQWLYKDIGIVQILSNGKSSIISASNIKGTIANY